MWGVARGIDTIALARLVGPAGRVIGIDHDAAMIAEAQEHAKQAGVSAFIKCQRGDATSMAFEPGEFDACRSERLFMHLPDPDQAMEEMRRVTKPRGRVVVVDTDWGSVSIDTDDFEVERQLACFRAERLLNNGYAGRRLYRLFKKHDLVDLSVGIFPLYLTELALARYLTKQDEVEEQAVAEGIISQQDLERWGADLAQADSANMFFASLNLIMVAGRKA